MNSDTTVIAMQTAHGIRCKQPTLLLAQAFLRALICVVVVVPFASCSPKQSEPDPKLSSTQPPKRTALGLHGFNYTDLPISEYTVNGNGGGDVQVSGEGAGGSKTTCCMAIPTYAPWTYHVSWSRDDHRWCELDVVFKGPIPKDPISFNTHFYQDGHVEISVSDDYEAPRIDLPSIDEGMKRHPSGNAINDDKFASCKDGQ